MCVCACKEVESRGRGGGLPQTPAQAVEFLASDLLLACLPSWKMCYECVDSNADSNTPSEGMPCVPTMCQALLGRQVPHRTPLSLELTDPRDKLEQTSDDMGHGLNPKTPNRSALMESSRRHGGKWCLCWALKDGLGWGQP